MQVYMYPQHYNRDVEQGSDPQFPAMKHRQDINMTLTRGTTKSENTGYGDTQIILLIIL